MAQQDRFLTVSRTRQGHRSPLKVRARRQSLSRRRHAWCYNDLRRLLRPRGSADPDADAAQDNLPPVSRRASKQSRRRHRRQLRHPTFLFLAFVAWRA
jgi:hypothetical protein